MGYFGDSSDVQQCGIGITDTFDEDGPGLGGDPPAERLRIIWITHLIDPHAETGIDPLETVHRTAVEMRGRQNPPPTLSHTEQGIGDGRHP